MCLCFVALVILRGFASEICCEKLTCEAFASVDWLDLDYGNRKIFQLFDDVGQVLVCFFFVAEGRSRNTNMFQQAESYLARILYLGKVPGVFQLLQSGLCMSTDHSISTYQTVLKKLKMISWTDFYSSPAVKKTLWTSIATRTACHLWSAVNESFHVGPKWAKSRPTIAAVPSCASHCHKPQAIASTI